jgi:hypothetical protein
MPASSEYTKSGRRAKWFVKIVTCRGNAIAADNSAAALEPDPPCNLAVGEALLRQSLKRDEYS